MLGGFSTHKYCREDLVIDYFVLKACGCYIVQTAESYQLCCFSFKPQNDFSTLRSNVRYVSP